MIQERKNKFEPLNLVDQRFGRLVVKRNTGRRSNGQQVWFCVCDCGGKSTVKTHDLTGNRTRSCGCLKREFSRSKAKDLSGLRFGRLLVIGRNKNHWIRRDAFFDCLCDCGATVVVRSSYLRTGVTRSCGCLRRLASAKSLAGKRFGRLLVLGVVSETTSERGLKWLTKCDCGRTKVIAGKSMSQGLTKSCGCLNNELAASLVFRKREGASDNAARVRWYPHSTEEEYSSYLEMKRALRKVQKCLTRMKSKTQTTRD